MEMMAETNCADIDFEVDPVLQEVLVVLHRPAEECARRSENSSASVNDLIKAVASIKEIGITELLMADDLDCSSSAVLFHVADLLAQANVTVAWQALAAVPANIALSHLRQQAGSMDWLVALPSGSQWLQMQPLFDPSETAEVCWFDGLRVLPPAEHSPPATGSSLLGFPHGRFSAVPAPSSTDPRWQSLSKESRIQIASLTQALFGGLLQGALRRLVSESYGYAKHRKSAGKPISQHQAVALRLADLALHQQALSLYLQNRCSSSRQGLEFDAVSIGYVGETAARISRDAVQIAGAHGYVDGLPFKRLFEQVRTLTSGLQFWQSVALLDGTRLHGMQMEKNA